MNFEDRFHRFQFQNDLLLDQKIEPDSTFQFEILIDDGKAYLTPKLQFPEIEFMTETGLINRFQ